MGSHRIDTLRVIPGIVEDEKPGSITSESLFGLKIHNREGIFYPALHLRMRLLAG
jgi:hypothetical protein